MGHQMQASLRVSSVSSEAYYCTERSLHLAADRRCSSACMRRKDQ